MSIIQSELIKPYYAGLTILGGEPLNPQNRHQVANIIKELKKTMRTDQDIWVYTGYKLGELIKENDSDIEYILDNINTLVDGPFIQNLKNISLKFRGSENQRVINIIKIPGSNKRGYKFN